MNIVWFSWKDCKHPKAGGAENVSWHLMQKLVESGHSVHLITSRYQGSSSEDTINGVTISRAGNQFTVYFRAFFQYLKVRHKADLLVDEMNTIPFGCGFYSRKPRVLLTYQLARQVWFYQMPFPLSFVGYIIEPLYLFMLSRRYHLVATESESTRQDLLRYGFRNAKVGIFRVGSELEPLPSLPVKKNSFIILVHGSVRPMKRTLDAVKAFEVARDHLPELKLAVSGDYGGSYGNKVLRYVASSRHTKAIEMIGRTSNKQRIDLMRSAALILVTSIKEGWGLIVTEANSQGTPAVTYDCDGLRDSVIRNKTGIVVPSGDYQALGLAVTHLLTGDRQQYEKLRHAGWKNSKQYTFDNSYRDFSVLLGLD